MPDTTIAPDEAPQESKTFADFGVASEICEALTEAGITSPFPIQELTLPLALAGADLIGQARTGTGKTLAFGIPLIQRADPSLRVTQALVIVPTRELCLQVAEDLARAGARIQGLDVVAVYGGKALEPQAKAVEQGAQIVVGTPGRLLDLMRRGSLRLGEVSGLVLDEADEMLDLGFLPDVEQLIQATAEGRQTLLFSATMPSAVVALARRYMHKPTFLRADVEEVHVAPKTKQHFFSCHRMDKPAVVARILQSPNRGLCVIFTRTKRMADVLAEELRDRNIKAAPIHSDLRQEAREKALERFRSGRIDVLVATEVAARGLDIDDVTHVVNYDCPDDEKMYLHRIGRTGRAGAAGVAITMAVWNELARLEMIKKALDISEPTHEVFSTSPILDELFDLPARDEVRRAAKPPAEPKPRAESKSRVESRTRRDAGDDAPVGADADELPASGMEPEEHGEDAPRKRRRRGGRGRGRGGAAAGDAMSQDEQDEPEAREARPEPRPSRPEQAEQDSDDGAGVRRRTRRRVSPGEERAAEPAEAAQAEPTGDGDERVRVRRRVRTTGTGGSRPVEPVERPAPRRREPAERAARAERAERADKDKSSDRGGSAGSKPARSGDSQRRASSGGDARRGSARERDAARRGGRGRDPRRESERRPAVDSDEARGQGKPGIVRPLRISHLP